MKTNFRKSENDLPPKHNNAETKIDQKNLTQDEFEEYISKSGAKGSFMVYRSAKKDEELGLDEL